MTNKNKKANIMGNRVKSGVVIDPATGEVIWDNIYLLIWSSSGPKEDERFWKVFDFLTIALKNGLTKTESRVLGWIIENKLNFHNIGEPIYLNKEQIEKDLKIKSITIRNALYGLTKKDILIALKKGQPIYMVNPKFIWIGNAELRQKAISEYEKIKREKNNGKTTAHQKAAHR